MQRIKYIFHVLLFVSISYISFAVPPGWSYQRATASSALIGIESAGSYVVSGRPIANGDAVGAFFVSSADTICAGYFVWDGVQFGFAVSGDDATTQAKDGFAQGEKYIFKIWDSALNTVTVANPSFSSGSDVFSQNAVSVLNSLICGRQAVLPLRAGWNLVSSPLTHFDSTFTSCINAASANLLYAKNQSGSIYSKNEIDGISQWHRGDAFYMYSAAADTLLLYGSAIQQMTINLGAGWNLMPYCKLESNSPSVVFSAVLDKIVLVSDDSGHFFMPAYGINTIGSLAPGKAYRVFAKQSCSIVY